LEKLFLSFIRGPLSSFNASNRNIDFFQKKRIGKIMPDQKLRSFM
jgi:hypothetical protein